MKPKEILVFGASGQIGRHLIRKLTKNNYKVVAVTRNIHQKGYILKTQANPGYLEIVELPYFNIEKINNLLEECSICINLIGILFEKRKNYFKNIHTDFPDLLSKLSAEKNIEKLIHISSLGVEKSLDSNYANSKLEGENKVKKNFDRVVVLKPSIVYSVDDNFTTNFMTLLNRLPIMPLYYEGKN
jgi:NAD dependent epimerase/dehydratase family.